MGWNVWPWCKEKFNIIKFHLYINHLFDLFFSFTFPFSYSFNYEYTYFLFPCIQFRLCHRLSTNSFFLRVKKYGTFSNIRLQNNRCSLLSIFYFYKGRFHIQYHIKNMPNTLCADHKVQRITNQYTTSRNYYWNKNEAEYDAQKTKCLLI